MRIFCDFDGTISVKDTTDALLDQFALPEWEAIEAQWQRGEIGSAECMRSQVALLRVNKEDLDAAIDALDIDTSFLTFVNFCTARRIPLTVISDGIDYVITRILSRYHLGYLPVIANHLVMKSDGRYTLTTPHMNPACTLASGVCKCAKLSAQSAQHSIVFVGDGPSDFCAAGAADWVFAKARLATYCNEHSIAFTPYQHFDDVTRAMQNALRITAKRTEINDHSHAA
jgi:2-hydroxy-3-keto-5-methylthiopentenyl-1-phosphate phosphatase